MACFSRFKLAIRAKDKGFPLSPMSPVFISGPEAFPASDVEDSESDPPRNKGFPNEPDVGYRNFFIPRVEKTSKNEPAGGELFLPKGLF